MCIVGHPNVNVRPWPKDFEIADPWVAPPCGLETEMVVVDLAVMELVGRLTKLKLFLGNLDDCLDNRSQFDVNDTPCHGKVQTCAESFYLWRRPRAKQSPGFPFDFDSQNLCSRQVTRHFVATTSCDSGIIIDRHTGVRVARYRTYHLHSQHYNHSNQWSSSWLRTPLTLQFSSRLPHSSCTCCVVNPHNSEQVSLISKNCWLWNYIMYVWGFLYLRFKQLVDLALYTAKILYLGNVRISKICQKF